MSVSIRLLCDGVCFSKHYANKIQGIVNEVLTGVLYVVLFHHQKLYMLVRGSCLSCHMLTCPRATIHLLVNQLKLLDVGAMTEVCELPNVLNQVSMKNLSPDRAEY